MKTTKWSMLVLNVTNLKAVGDLTYFMARGEEGADKISRTDYEKHLNG